MGGAHIFLDAANALIVMQKNQVCCINRVRMVIL